MILALLGAASASTLHISPDTPPVQVGPTTWSFDGTVLEVRDGVVFYADEPPPGALSLGGGAWRLPTADPVGTALRLSQEPGFVAVFPDVVLVMEPRFDDPSYGGQWYLQELGMEALYEKSMGSPDVRVAVMDSGIDIRHSDLASAVDQPLDAVDNDEDPSPPTNEDTHGTAVSGIVLSRADNGVGIVGICPECTLIPIRILGESGGTLADSVEGFEHAVAADAWVINNSWGYSEHFPVPSTLEKAITRATTEPRGGLGAVVIFAAGNDNREVMGDEMEALPDVLCVSAVDSYGYPTGYTNYGEPVDFAAPSATVTIGPGDTVVENFGGTSAAAPVASGMAAWILAQDPTLSAKEVADLLISTAQPSPYVQRDADGHDPKYGYGLLDAQAILEHFYPSPVDSGDTGLPEEEGGCGGCGGGGGLALAPALLMALAARRRA